MTLVPAMPQQATTNKHTLHVWGSKVLKRVFLIWNRVKIAKLSKYSTERAEALDKYCQHTSLLRVLLLCALIPWPSLLLELVIECIPVNEPERGLEVNVGACFRVTIIVFSVAAGTLFQVRATTPGLTGRKILIIVLITGCGATLIMFGICSWMFPFPFSVVFVGLTAGALFVLSFLLATKRESVRISITPAQEVVPVPKTSLRQSVYLFIAQGVLVAVYLTFSSIFTACSFKERVALLLFLPIMKLGLKHMVARLAFGSPESIPAVVVFTVDVFNGLYSSICIQAAKSWRTSLLMIALNFSNTMISIFEIDQAAQLFRELDRKDNDSAQVQALWDTNSDSRYRSSSLVQSAKWHTQTTLNAKGTTNIAGVMVLPSRQSASVTTRKSDISTALLFHLEYRALVGYIEAAIPMLYAVHLSILVHIPSAKYYPNTRNLTSDQLQTNVLSISTYAAAEILSLVLLHVVVKRKLGFSLLYQLAYVLETEAESLQGRLFVWIVLLLQLPLVHFGVDFSFRFEWLS